MSEIPKTCKAGCVVNDGPGFHVVVEDVPVPTPGPDQLLVRLNATGICFSDITYMEGGMGVLLSQLGVRSPGHEGAGVVVQVGASVDGKEWKVGDRVGIKPVWDACMNCERCWDKREMHCKKNITTGLRVAGTYQQYLTSPAKYTTRIPDSVDDFTAGPIMCSGATIYRSLMAAGLKTGDWVVFPGSGGGVGHMGVQLAKAMGFRVIGIDTGAEKAALCLRLGCEHFLDFKEVESVEKEVVKLTGGEGAHAVLVTTGSASAYKSAPSMVRPGGKIMCVGLPKPGQVVAGADPLVMVGKNLSVIGTAVASMLDTQIVLEFAARGLVKPVYEIFPISELPKAVEKLRSGQVAGRLVIDFNS